VFYHKETGKPLLTEDTIAHIKALVAERGTDAWWELEVSLGPRVKRSSR
jgi:isoleucyl-tRNA synthetase